MIYLYGMKVIVTESQFRKILNESEWEGKSVGITYIMNNAFNYMNDESKKTVKGILPKIPIIKSVIPELDSNRQKIANIMTQQGFSGDQISEYNLGIKPNDLKIYRNAAETVYNSSTTQTFINNIITQVVNNLSPKQYIILKGLWAIKSQTTLKENITKAIQKIAHLDTFKIQNPTTKTYSPTLNRTFIEFEKMGDPVFDDTILVDSIYDTINELL